MLSADGSTQVGKISKEWSGMLNEMFTDADNFGISFPMDLDVNMKAVVMGAAFLIVSSYSSPSKVGCTEARIPLKPKLLREFL